MNIRWILRFHFLWLHKYTYTTGFIGNTSWSTQGPTRIMAQVDYKKRWLCIAYKMGDSTKKIQWRNEGRICELQKSIGLSGDTRWRSWLRHCATSRKVAGTNPNGVTGIFYWHNPSGRTMGQWLTQPPTKWVPGIFPGDKGGRRLGLTTLLLSCADCLEIWEPQPSGTLSACPDL